MWKTGTRSSTESPSRWIHAKHVDYLDELLLQLFAGELRNQGYIGLIIEEPPRHGKSEMCSHFAPAWYLGSFPDNRVMLASYEADFAASWGGKVRDTLTEYGEQYFGVTVDRKTTARDLWNVSGHRGGMYTAGVGGALTGKGANLLIVDDPVKNMKDAQSEIMRQNAWEWYKSTFRTRLEPDGVILMIGTRWHEDDLIGRVIREMEEGDPDDPDIDRFLVIRLPAIAEDPSEDYPDPDPLGRVAGEALFPERWPVHKLAPHRNNEYVWAALFQQRPAPLEGGLFHQDWFEVVPGIPRGVKIKKQVRRWDMAATDPKKGEDPDYTVGLLMADCDDGYVYVMDMVMFRESPGATLRKMGAVAALDTRRVRIRVEQEPGSAGKIVVWNLGKTIFRGYAYRGIRSTGDKILRAETVSAAAERGEIKVVKGRWNRDFFGQVTKFPNAAHDDVVDALSGGYEDLVVRKNVMVTA